MCNYIHVYKVTFIQNESFLTVKLQRMLNTFCIILQQ